jgi:hypothetical protein
MYQGILIIGILVLLYFIHNNSVYEYFTDTSVMSSIDKRLYKVVGGFTDKKEAANIMAELSEFIVEFLRFLKNKFIVNRRGTKKEQEFVNRLLRNYNPDMIFENDPKPGEDTSFVINKGEKFGICLRNKQNTNIHDKPILHFVIIHELTHMGTIEYGHEYEFWSWMKFMVIQAKEAGLYNPVDYSINKTSYCGIPVTSNPYFVDKYNHNLI